MTSRIEVQEPLLWNEASAKLERLVRRYSSGENVEMRTLYYVILPLKEQFDSGQRTSGLYREIMELKE